MLVAYFVHWWSFRFSKCSSMYLEAPDTLIPRVLSYWCWFPTLTITSSINVAHRRVQESMYLEPPDTLMKMLIFVLLINVESIPVWDVMFQIWCGTHWLTSSQTPSSSTYREPPDTSMACWGIRLRAWVHRWKPNWQQISQATSMKVSIKGV